MNTKNYAKALEQIRHHLNAVDMLFNPPFDDPLNPDDHKAYLDEGETS